MWHCEYKFPYDYYALIDEETNIIKTSFNKKDLKAAKKLKIIKKHYKGCPAHNNDLDDFNF